MGHFCAVHFHDSKIKIESSTIISFKKQFFLTVILASHGPIFQPNGKDSERKENVFQDTFHAPRYNRCSNGT